MVASHAETWIEIDNCYDQQYADSRADTAWSQNMTERQYEDSRADTMYSRAQEASAPRLDLDTALSMYASGVQSSEVMKTLQHYLGDDADAASLSQAAALTDDSNISVALDEAKDYLAENDVDDRFAELLMTPEEFERRLNTNGGYVSMEIGGSNVTKKFRDYADYVAAFAEYYAKKEWDEAAAEWEERKKRYE